jgi:hypothetical protein
LVVDPAGEWHRTNKFFMHQMVKLGAELDDEGFFVEIDSDKTVDVNNPPSQSDKRLVSRAELAVKLSERKTQAIMTDTKLECDMWQFVMHYVWQVHNLYPLSRNATSSGRGPRPLTEMSKNYVDESECDRRIYWAQQPGTFAYVHRGDGKKRTGVLEPGNGKWCRAIGIDKDVPVFESIPRNKNNSTTRSKNFAVMELKPGVSAYEKYGIEPPSPLPLNATTKTPQMLRGIRNIVRLSEWFVDREDNIEPDIRGISDSTGTLPTFLTMEPEGRILRNEGDVLRPTGGFVHIIPAGLSKPSDFARAREILEECLDAYPDFLIGHAAHKPFTEWNNKCARGRVTGIDKDHAGNTLWQIRYEADGKEEDYDKSDMIQYVIRREFGVSDPDGGISAMLQARARARETCAVPGPEPESSNSRRESIFSESDDTSASKQSGGENTSGKSTSKSTTKISTVQPNQDVYETSLDDSWATVRKNCGVTIDQQRDFLRWLRKMHNIGSSPQCKMAEKVGTGMWFKSPIGGRKTRSPWSVPAGTKFPVPSGELWDEITKKHELREKELRLDHLQNQAAAAAAFAEECMVNTGRLYFIEEMFDLNHMSEQEKPDYLYYVDKVNEGYIDPGADPKQSKYTDSRGLPIAPKSYKDLYTRGNDPSVKMWVNAGEAEWTGLIGRQSFIHDLSKNKLRDMGILQCEQNPDGKLLVNMRTIFDVKETNGVFAKAKARTVVAGHSRSIRRNVDYQTQDVFAPAPRLETGRTLQAFACMFNMHRYAVDAIQAYLIGTPSPDQHYPVRYPDGPIRERHRDKKTGEERFAIAIGNVYGIPSAGKTWANERDRVLLKHLPSVKKGWAVSTATYDPCVFIIRSPRKSTDRPSNIKSVSGQEHANNAHRRVYCDTTTSEASLFNFGDDKFNTTYISIHTDDLDIIGDSLDDIKEVVSVLDSQFGHNGNAGVKVIDPKEVLGVRRIEGTDGKGTRYLHLHQAFKCDELWDSYGEECPRRKPPSYPFPYSKEKHPEITNDGKHVGGSEAEAKRIHAKGYRQVVGSILWLARNSAPIVSYGASILSKCMQAPDQQAWDAAMHVVHYLKGTGKEGMTYHNSGNLEPVCYYDSGFNQTKLQTHPQYGFIIYWCGAPIIWRSKRHPLTPHSVSQAEHQTLRHAWSYIKWLRELLKDLGLGQYVRRPTLCIGDNRNARDWANERVLSEGNQHLDRHYFTVRERVALGEILPIWIEGLYNPADTMTKAINAPTTEQHMKYIFGREEIPLPEGVKVWFGPPDKPVLRANLISPAAANSANMVQAQPVMRGETADYGQYEPEGDARLPYDHDAESSDDEGDDIYSGPLQPFDDPEFDLDMPGGSMFDYPMPRQTAIKSGTPIGFEGIPTRMAIKSGTPVSAVNTGFKTGVSRRDLQPRGQSPTHPRKPTVPGVQFNMTPTDVRIYGIDDRNRMRSLRDYKRAKRDKQRRSTRVAAPVKPKVDPTSLESQRKMASDNKNRYQNDLIVMRSSLGGKGLFARRNLPIGYEIDYYGEFFDSVEALEQANQGESQYVIGCGKRNNYTVLVNGERVPTQFAIYANHQPRKKANAILAWDTDRYYGSTPVGQPVLMLTKPVAPGDEVTVDYGPNFAYQKHGFSRNTSSAKRPRAGASSTPSSAFLATPSVMTATTTFKSDRDFPW